MNAVVVLVVAKQTMKQNMSLIEMGAVESFMMFDGWIFFQLRKISSEKQCRKSVKPVRNTKRQLVPEQSASMAANRLFRFFFLLLQRYHRSSTPDTIVIAIATGDLFRPFE